MERKYWLLILGIILIIPLISPQLQVGNLGQQGVNFEPEAFIGYYPYDFWQTNYSQIDLIGNKTGSFDLLTTGSLTAGNTTVSSLSTFNVGGSGTFVELNGYSGYYNQLLLQRWKTTQGSTTWEIYIPSLGKTLNFFNYDTLAEITFSKEGDINTSGNITIIGNNICNATACFSLQDLNKTSDTTAFLRKDGSTPLTANWNVGGFNITNITLLSTRQLNVTLIKINETTGACDLTINHSICANQSGLWIIGNFLPLIRGLI